MNTLSHLRSLAGDPRRQAAEAVDLLLLKPRARADILQAALQILSENPSPEAHDALVTLYLHYAMNGAKLDSGAYLRSAVLDALRPVVQHGARGLLIEAVQTYEFLPPDFLDEAGRLRGSALLVLNELNDETTAYHAGRLLGDAHFDQMSGEPAVTAARVLGNRGEMLPLYLYVMADGGTRSEEASGECLRNMDAIPAELLPGIIDSVRQRSSPAELAGLFDLLLGHTSGPQELAFVTSYLTAEPDLDVFRYVVLTALIARRKELTEMVVAVSRLVTDRARREILVEALAHYAADPDIQAVLESFNDQP